MDDILRDLYDKGVGAYVDDIFVFNATLEEHLKTLSLVLDRLQENNLTVNLKKC